MPLQGKILVHDWKNLGFRSGKSNILTLNTLDLISLLRKFQITMAFYY